MQLFQIAEYSNWPVAVLAVGLFYKLPKELKVFAAYVFLLPFFVEYINSFSDAGQNNMHLKHILVHVEMLVYTLTYYQLLVSYQAKKLLLYVLSFYVVFSVVNTIYFESFHLFPSNISLVSSVIYLLYTLLFYHQIYTENTVRYLEKYPYFWFNSGILFYYLSSTIFSLFYNYIVYNQSMEFYFYFEKIDSILFILFKICISLTLILAFLENRKRINEKKIKPKLSSN